MRIQFGFIKIAALSNSEEMLLNYYLTKFWILSTKSEEKSMYKILTNSAEVWKGVKMNFSKVQKSENKLVKKKHM